MSMFQVVRASGIKVEKQGKAVMPRHPVDRLVKTEVTDVGAKRYVDMKGNRIGSGGGMKAGKVLQTMGIVGGVKRVGEMPPVEKVQREAKKKMEEAIAKMRAEEREIQRREEAKREAREEARAKEESAVSHVATSVKKEEREAGVAVEEKRAESGVNAPVRVSVVIAAEDLMPSEDGSGLEVREYEIVETPEDKVSEKVEKEEDGEWQGVSLPEKPEGMAEVEETKEGVGMSAAAEEFLGKKKRRRRGKKGKKGDSELFA